MRSIAPEGGMPEGDQDDPYIDADFEIKKEPLRYRLFPSLKRRKDAKAGMTTYWEIYREEVDYGIGFEYVCREVECKKADVPRAVVHITGMKGARCLVDLLPRYPEYADPDAETDDNGNFVRPHNYFDAFGYYKYFTDQRIKRGYDALGRMSKYKPPMDWQKLALVAVAVVVAVAVFTRFL